MNPRPLKFSNKAYVVALMILWAARAVSQAQLINGDFQTGDFTGWTLFTTPQGGLGGATVVLFDTANTGSPSDSARFEAGQTSGTVTGVKYGGGIFQNMTLGAGQLNVSLNIASESPGANGDGGTFELLLDGTVVASHAFSSMAPSQPQWSTLSYSGSVTSGAHEIEVEVLRGSYLQVGETPYQYLDNVQLSGSAVPEPSTGLLLLLAGMFIGLRVLPTAGLTGRCAKVPAVKPL
jgi:hypothetical protein